MLKTFLDRKFIFYLISGLGAFTVEFSVFNLLDVVFNTNLLVANSVSFFTGLITSYSLNEYFVFKKTDFAMNAVARKGSYLILAGINLLLTNAFIWMFVHFGLNNAVAKLMTMGLVVIWNYLVFSKFIFKPKD